MVWFVKQRWRLAKLCFDIAKTRLTILEAYDVCRSIIDWGAPYSEDRIPGQVVGADALNLKIMHWAMASWERVDFLNTQLFGHLMPRVQVDLLPGILRAGRFALVACQPVQTIDAYIEAGRAMQRSWLTAASLGSHVQAEKRLAVIACHPRQVANFPRIGPA